MPEIDHRPISGGGSCDRCGESLGLASLKQRGVWYCSSGCAEGEVRGEVRSFRVPEPWLYARPRRFFRKRGPKELRSTRPGD